MQTKQQTKAISQARGFKQSIDSKVWDADSFTDQYDMDQDNMDCLANWASQVTIYEPDLYHVN